ncbi:acetyl-CoA synthetase-like protein [Aspergillus sclerotiicarbonarius CBS 121057]|uniref:Acetyl-CoA synthetase-like protein n=1 Tax=Aspergillus sclerotiicarbonarius (strain CBS 121057 / IBT 28362) TaxID=1448318 RepID=A0A319E1E3_ASPSB|nr:acetyl-CoA synthetase-like protein [Aspergillus sclerotiicarbonarius CBS 121057]
MSEAPPPRADIPPIFQTSAAKPDRLVHLIPDELAAAVPDHPLFAYARAARPQDGFVDVSCWRFANAVNRASWYLRYLLGPPRDFATVGYMGPSDLRYFLFMFGAIKVGYKMPFLSPRNNLEGHLNVLEGVDCNVFLRAKETNIDPILDKRPMLSWVVPELDDFLEDFPVATYPYTKTFEDAWSDPCLVLHTTGSTGLPNPITWKVGILSTYEAWRTIPSVDGYVSTTEIYQQSRRAYTSMPLFHTSGLNAGITWAMLLGVTLVYGAPQVVPNAAYTDEMHQFAGVDASMGAPSIYEELSRDPQALERINRLHYVVASGAPLSHNAGDLISKHTRRLAPSIEDWPYFRWHPSHSGIEMRETVDGLYELFLVKDPNLKLYQGVFNTFPDVSEWSMKDLYSRHPDPSKPYLYMYRCRRDDVIVLSNGEKIAPALMEATLMSNPLIKGAMIVGQGQFQPVVLIELFTDPPHDPKARYQILESLAPAHGKLDQYHVLFADPAKPIRYLGQGKIQRKSTYALYEKEIEELYRAVDEGNEELRFWNVPDLEVHDTVEIARWLGLLITQVTGLGALEQDRDIFPAGVDSLQVMQMTRELRFQAKRLGLAEATDLFPPASIYTHPTIAQLADYIGHRLTGQNLSNGIPGGESSNAHMQTLLHRYAASLPHSSGLSPLPPTQNMVVLLTGSTGSLGSYLLDALQEDPNVTRIICLNRSANAAEKQVQFSFERGLNAIDPSRVELLQADLSRPLLGLEETTYERLQQSVTHILHNQWAVNFNWSLSTFDPLIRGVRHLIDLAHTSQRHAFIMFISSVSAVGSWANPGPVPEEPIHDFHVASRMGHGQSKLISECLLDQATRVSGVRSASCRVGIVAGPVEQALGLWNPQEYIPSIIISSPHLNAFPITFPSRDQIDWIPVDKASKILLEILSHASQQPPTNANTATSQMQVFHVINPQSTSWSKFAPDMLASYPDSLDLAAVDFETWMRLLEVVATTTTDTDTTDVPAVKLLDFFRRASTEHADARQLSSLKAQQASPALCTLGKVNARWLRNWMVQWGWTEYAHEYEY